MSEPTTFAKWWEAYDEKWTEGDIIARAAYAAGVASQQARLDARLDDYENALADAETRADRLTVQLADARAEIERLNEALRVCQQSINWQSAPDFAKLSAVVEAARAYVNRIEAEAAAVEPWNAPEIDYGIQRAVAELDRLTGERQ